jgi:hypothetical protein
MRLGAFLMLVVCTTASLVWAQDDSDAAVRSSIIADIRALDSILDTRLC